MWVQTLPIEKCQKFLRRYNCRKDNAELRTCYIVIKRRHLLKQKLLTSYLQKNTKQTSAVPLIDAAAELQLWFSFIGGRKRCRCISHVRWGDIASHKKLLQIMSTLPVTTCISERSFSTLRRLDLLAQRRPN